MVQKPDCSKNILSPLNDVSVTAVMNARALTPWSLVHVMTLHQLITVMLVALCYDFFTMVLPPGKPVSQDDYKKVNRNYVANTVADFRSRH